jgi:hypothetical protein
MTLFIHAVTLVGLLALGPAVHASGVAPGAQAAKQISAADAAPFLGEWTLALQGPNGPGMFSLSIAAEKEKVTAEIASEAQAKQAISNISLADKSLVLAYSFNYEGNPVDAVVSLTPDKDGKTAAQIDFAGGAYVMTGTATKKEPVKDK